MSVIIKSEKRENNYKENDSSSLCVCVCVLVVSMSVCLYRREVLEGDYELPAARKRTN